MSFSISLRSVYMCLYKWSVLFAWHSCVIFKIHSTSLYFSVENLICLHLNYYWYVISYFCYFVNCLSLFCTSFVVFCHCFSHYHCSLVIFCNGNIWVPPYLHLCDCSSSAFYTFVYSYNNIVLLFPSVGLKHLLSGWSSSREFPLSLLLW